MASYDNRWKNVRYLRIYKDKPTEPSPANSLIYANGRQCFPIYIRIGFVDEDDKPIQPDQATVKMALRLFSSEGKVRGNEIDFFWDEAPSGPEALKYLWGSSYRRTVFRYDEDAIRTSARLRDDINEVLRRTHTDSAPRHEFTWPISGQVNGEDNLIASPSDPAYKWNRQYFEHMFDYAKNYGLPLCMSPSIRASSDHTASGSVAGPPNLMDDVLRYVNQTQHPENIVAVDDKYLWHDSDQNVIRSQNSPGALWDKAFFLAMVDYARTKGLPWYTPDTQFASINTAAGLRVTYWKDNGTAIPPNIMTDVKHVMQLKQCVHEYGDHWRERLRPYESAIANQTPVPSTTHDSIFWDADLFHLIMNHAEDQGLPIYCPVELGQSDGDRGQDYTDGVNTEDLTDIRTESDENGHESHRQKKDKNPLDMGGVIVPGEPDEPDFPFEYDNDSLITMRLYVYTKQATSKTIIACIQRGNSGSEIVAHTGHDNPEDKDGWGRANGRDERRFDSCINVRSVPPYSPPASSSDWGEKDTATELSKIWMGSLDGDKTWQYMRLSLSYHGGGRRRWVDGAGSLSSYAIWRSSGKDGGQEWAVNYIALPGQLEWIVPEGDYHPGKLKGDIYDKGFLKTIVRTINQGGLWIIGPEHPEFEKYVYIGHLEGHKNWKFQTNKGADISDNVFATIRLMDDFGTEHTIGLNISTIDKIKLI